MQQKIIEQRSADVKTVSRAAALRIASKVARSAVFSVLS